MTMKHIISTVDCHVSGEPARILLSGFPDIRGNTMLEKLQYFRANFDYVRKGLMREPRGYDGMFGVVLTQPTNPAADLGAFFMDGGGYTYMCGHGTLCLGQAATQLGLAEPRGSDGELAVETPAGIVRVFVRSHEGHQEVTLRNLPSFMYKSDVVVDVPTVGSVTVDIAFGGIFFAMVDAEKLGLELSSTNVSRLVQVALAIRTAINGAVQVRHPSEPTSGRIESVVIYGQARHPEAWQRNIDVFGKGQFDRSPCGTATCARMAILHARGRLDLEQVFVNESIVGSLLKGRLVGVTHIGDYEAVLPEITGVPFIIGLNQWIIDPSDALYDGLAWGEGADR